MPENQDELSYFMGAFKKMDLQTSNMDSEFKDIMV